MHPTAPDLCRSVEDARARTLALVGDLEDAQLEVPELEHVNPFLWELGHVAFFYDHFVLGLLDGSAPMIERARERFESFQVEHARRWHLDFPDRAGVLEYMARVQACALERLRTKPLDARTSYLYQLALLHEDMHGEAFTYMRQALGYSAPSAYGTSCSSELAGVGLELSEAGPLPGDVAIPGGRFLLGAEPESSFSFDNEGAAHWVDIHPFSISIAALTNVEFLAFVQSQGYAERGLWSPAGWAWKTSQGIDGPVNWRPDGSGWLQLHFGQLRELAPHQPMVHLSYFEAEAYCRFASRRLPSEAEWELAASGYDAGPKRLYPWGDAAPDATRAQLDSRVLDCADVGAFPAGDSELGCRQMLGNIWEWTSSDFYPYPGFVVDRPYREYSAPWFGDRKVLRGGAWATRSRLIRSSYRNFFPPERRDILAGFRTCAL